MAGEEDVELRDLVAHTLETKGVLGKIRAQLRANVFLALEEQESQQKPHPLVSSKFQQYLKTKDGQIATALVREFLTFFDLDYTRSVFDPETNSMESCPGRHQLAKDLGLDVSTSSGPLLGNLLQRATHNHIPATLPQPPLNTETPTSSTVAPPITCTAPAAQLHPVASGSSVVTTSTTTTTSMDALSNSDHRTIHMPGLSGDPPPLDSHNIHHSTHPDSKGSFPPRIEPLHLPASQPTNSTSNPEPLQFPSARTEFKPASSGGQNTLNMSDGQHVPEATGVKPLFDRSTAGVTSQLGGGGQVNGRNREVNDIFDKKLPPHLDDFTRRKLEESSYQDGSDVSISEQSEVKSSARSVTKLEETEDLTLSQSSLGDFDYAESAKT